MGKREGKVIDTYEHRGFSIPIRLDKGEMKFYATVNDQHLSNKDGQLLKHDIYMAIEAILSATEWIAVIEVEELEPFASGGSFCGVDAKRFYISKAASGKWFDCRWDIPEEERHKWMKEFWEGNACKDFSLPRVKQTSHHKCYLLPYTEELWAGVRALEEALRTLKERLRHLLGSPEYVQLAAFGSSIMQKALTIGQPPTEGETGDETDLSTT